MTTDAIILSSEEIADLRLKLADNQQALATLDVIEEDCDGHLEDAFQLLKSRQENKETERDIKDLLKSVNSLLELADKYSKDICKDEVQDILELLTILSPLLDPTLALPLGIFVCKIGVKQFCRRNTP